MFCILNFEDKKPTVVVFLIIQTVMFLRTHITLCQTLRSAAGLVLNRKALALLIRLYNRVAAMAVQRLNQIVMVLVELFQLLFSENINQRSANTKELF